LNLFYTPVFLYRNAEQWSTLNFIIIRKTKTNCSELCWLVTGRRHYKC